MADGTSPPEGDDAAWAPGPGGERVRSEPPELLPGYRDFTQLARGGDSIVYRARQDGLDRDVAVKVVLVDDPETRARFERELQITVRLGRQHPHIVTVLATGTTRLGEPCLVMDYFELGSLHDRLGERGPLPVQDVVTAGSVVADALSFAHGQGVLHRDVKPQNILVLPTSYVLADFGLARAIDSGHSASLERFSYRHASPQVLDGEPPTVSDDVYSLGSTLFTLLDGRAPFAAVDPGEDSALSYLRRARTSSPRTLSRTDLPPELVTVVLRCLAKSPADRYHDADELRAALDAVPTESRGWAPGAPGASTAARAPARPEPRPEDAAFAPQPIAVRAPVTVDPEPPRPVAIPEPVAAPTPPPEPEPVAVSALAQLAAGTHVAPARDDSDVTGLRPMEPQPAAPALPRRWPLYVAVIVVALVAGLLLGFWKTGGKDPSASPTSQITLGSSGASQIVAIPTISGHTVGPADVKVDKSLTPKVLNVRRRGKAVLITFTDPTQGKGLIVVVGTDFRGQAPKGATGVTIPDQPSGKQCYTISAWIGESDGFRRSPLVPACTSG